MFSYRLLLQLAWLQSILEHLPHIHIPTYMLYITRTIAIILSSLYICFGHIYTINSQCYLSFYSWANKGRRGLNSEPKLSWPGLKAARLQNQHLLTLDAGATCNSAGQPPHCLLLNTGLIQAGVPCLPPDSQRWTFPFMQGQGQCWRPPETASEL